MRPDHLLPSLAVVALLLLGGCAMLQPVAQSAPAVAGPCDDGLVRKVMVTAFPLRYPEQIGIGEYMGWPQATAEMLARTLERSGRMQALAAPQHFPFASAEAAPEVEHKAGLPIVAYWAREADAQHVVSGVFRDVGVVDNDFLVPERHMIVEAFIHDGIAGNLLARREFAWKLPLNWRMPRTMAPGTREFAESRLGRLYHALLDDIGRWAESTIACQPFALRVSQVDGQRLHFTVGGERGITPGMALQDWPPGGLPTPRRAGDLSPGGSVFATFKTVAPRTSIAEIPKQRNPPTARSGDVLYISPGTSGNKP